MNITIFYLFSVLFILSEIYYVFNKIRLDRNLKNRDIEAINKLDIVYYLSRPASWIWLIIGLFTPMNSLFMLIVGLYLLKIPFYYIGKKLYIIWNNLSPAFSIILYLVIIVYGIFVI